MHKQGHIQFSLSAISRVPWVHWSQLLQFRPPESAYNSKRSIRQSGKKVTARAPLTPISRHFLQCLQPSVGEVTGTLSWKPYDTHSRRATQTLRNFFHALPPSHMLSTSRCLQFQTLNQAIWKEGDSTSATDTDQPPFLAMSPAKRGRGNGDPILEAFSNHLVSNPLTPSKTSNGFEVLVVKNLKTPHIICPQRLRLAAKQQHSPWSGTCDP
ncbi:hypothetical protein CSKR_100852 [Clonorchis sinensis]|uniref:Uncharacterized protein n=1 Tax=Clonorchis sinensis TaxID=79923 RepID=A0A3R7G5L9_CLOSI|nr:hypothetical protein CSKR_100852 [Clonorchis sinensis]